MSRLQRFDPYDFYAGVYDATFGRVFGPRLKKAIQRLALPPGAKVLDIGIGTGLSLEFYPWNVKVVGVDLSNGMLEQAKRRIEAKGLQNVDVRIADAQQLPFADNAFDAVLMGHVLTVVNDPEKVLKEARRVVKPGGTIAVVNHFQLEWPVIGRIERALSPLFERIGWRTNVRFNDYLQHEELELVEKSRLHPADIWTVALFRNRKPVEEEVISRAAAGR